MSNNKKRKIHSFCVHGSILCLIFKRIKYLKIKRYKLYDLQEKNLTFKTLTSKNLNPLNYDIKFLFNSDKGLKNIRGFTYD